MYPSMGPTMRDINEVIGPSTSKKLQGDGAAEDENQIIISDQDSSPEPPTNRASMDIILLDQKVAVAAPMIKNED